MLCLHEVLSFAGGNRQKSSRKKSFLKKVLKFRTKKVLLKKVLLKKVLLLKSHWYKVLPIRDFIFADFFPGSYDFIQKRPRKKVLL